MQASAFSLLNNYGVDTSKINTFFVPIENVWIRDAGPRFLKSRDGQLAITNVKWTLYGYPKELDLKLVIILAGVLMDTSMNMQGL
jgi:agmatine/peptidylarginine deiminase